MAPLDSSFRKQIRFLSYPILFESQKLHPISYIVNFPRETGRSSIGVKSRFESIVKLSGSLSGTSNKSVRHLCLPWQQCAIPKVSTIPDIKFGTGRVVVGDTRLLLCEGET